MWIKVGLYTKKGRFINVNFHMIQYSLCAKSHKENVKIEFEFLVKGHDFRRKKKGK